VQAAAPAVLAARRRGAATVGLAGVSRPTLASYTDVCIVVETGPEAISGSTRLKAGTAQKLVLNAFSSTLMIRLGRVYGNLMVDVRATNAKLRQRAVRLVQQAAGVDADVAERVLGDAAWDVKLAIACLRLNLSIDEAVRRLSQSSGRLSDVLGEP